MEELIDVLNEDGTKTGKVVTRKEVHEKGLWHRIVVIAVIDKEGHLLMQQRSKYVKTNPEKWDISAAGHVSAGQTSREAAIREIKEEVGLEIKQEELRYITTYSEPTRRQGDIIDNQFFDFYIVIKPKIEMESIHIQESEVENVKLCDLEEVKEKLEKNIVVKRDIVYKEILQYLK